MSSYHPEVDGPQRRWLGARLDWGAVRRDFFLAGGFAGMNALAGTLDWAWVLPGALFGGGLGAFLHVLPADPHVSDSKSGRIIIRALSGIVGGAWAGAGVAVLVSGVAIDSSVAMPAAGDLLVNLAVGAASGAAWYIAWGFWEMRAGAPFRRRAAAEAAEADQLAASSAT